MKGKQSVAKKLAAYLRLFQVIEVGCLPTFSPSNSFLFDSIGMMFAFSLL